MWDHILPICRMNSIYQTLCAVQDTKLDQTQTQLTKQLSSKSIHRLQLIFMKTEENKVILMYQCSQRQSKEKAGSYQHGVQQERRQRDGRWIKGKKISALTEIIYCFRARTHLPLFQFQITMCLLNTSIRMVQNAPISTRLTCC